MPANSDPATCCSRPLVSPRGRSSASPSPSAPSRCSPPPPLSGRASLTAAAAAIWDLNAVIIGSILIVLALLVTVQAAQLSALWAKLPVPVIPAPGDPTPVAPSLRVLQDLPRRVRISDAHQTGFIAGGVLLATVAGSLTLVAPQSVSPWAWYVVAAAGLGAALRARVWDSAAVQGVAAGPAVPASVVASGGVRRERPVRRGVVGADRAGGADDPVGGRGAGPGVASPTRTHLPMRRLGRVPRPRLSTLR